MAEKVHVATAVQLLHHSKLHGRVQWKKPLLRKMQIRAEKYVEDSIFKLTKNLWSEETKIELLGHQTSMLVGGNQTLDTGNHPSTTTMKHGGGSIMWMLQNTQKSWGAIFFKSARELYLRRGFIFQQDKGYRGVKNQVNVLEWLSQYPRESGAGLGKGCLCPIVAQPDRTLTVL